MKTKFSLLFLIFISFTLMGCPAGSFSGYTLVDTNEDQMTYGDTRIVYDNKTELLISCGNYVQFIGTKERGLLATVKINSKEGTENQLFIEKIVSAKFGELSRTPALEPSQYMLRDTLNKQYYTLSLKDLSRRKMRKQVANDTISIALKNGTTLVFVKKDIH